MEVDVAPGEGFEPSRAKLTDLAGPLPTRLGDPSTSRRVEHP